MLYVNSKYELNIKSINLMLINHQQKTYPRNILQKILINSTHKSFYITIFRKKIENNKDISHWFSLRKSEIKKNSDSNICNGSFRTLMIRFRAKTIVEIVLSSAHVDNLIIFLIKSCFNATFESRIQITGNLFFNLDRNLVSVSLVTLRVYQHVYCPIWLSKFKKFTRVYWISLNLELYMINLYLCVCLLYY